MCLKGVGQNSIVCTKYKKWVHKKCSGVKAKLTGIVNFQCSKCLKGGLTPNLAAKGFKLDVDVELESVDKFCYLGDMIGAGGGVEEATRVRTRCAWGNCLLS